MNREEAKQIIENIEVIKAYAEGAELQYLSSPSKGKWLDASLPTFVNQHIYRRKPLTVWVNVRTHGGLHVHHTKQAAEQAASLNEAEKYKHIALQMEEVQDNV